VLAALLFVAAPAWAQASPEATDTRRDACE
jgi:hypothetical protein